MRGTRHLVSLAAAAGVAAIAERRGSLSPGGAAAATLVGTLAFASGWPSTRALLTFFLTSTLLSHLPRDGARVLPERSATQVLANGGVASVGWTMRLLGGPGHLNNLALGSLAAAAADTWATEIGQRWGGVPRLITSGRQVASGESGGVTTVGTFAALAGALVVALSGAEPRAITVMTLSGFFGSLADSVLGATLQARYLCSVCGNHIEQAAHCHQPAILESGFSWMTNDGVNALATLLGGVLGAMVGTNQRQP